MTEGSTPRYVATWATKTSCSNSASSMVSFARRSIGLRNNTIRARVEFPRTSTPAGISRASAMGPSATTSARSERSAWATETTLAINRGLAGRYGRSAEVTYRDIGHVFMRDGRLNRDLFLDPKLKPPEPPLHPTAQGAALMAETIEPTLAALLGDRQH